MTDYFADTLFDGRTLLNNVLFSEDKGVITAFTPDASKADTQNATHLAGLIVPGFVDIQVNGGGGVQFNDKPSADTLHIMTRAHRQYGTTSMLPTIITDDIDIMRQGADAVADVHAANPSGVVGIHFEGPHLSQAKKGMHSDAHLRPLTDAEMTLFSRKDIGQVMVTVAPEAVSCEQIKALVSAGVIVSVGHTNATFEQCMAAFEAGATGATHLFNAMSPLTSRAPGVVGAALYHDSVYCGLINDTHHVHPASAAVAIRAKGTDKTMLITDAMAPAGSDIDYFVYQGVNVYQRGETLNLEDGTLAGSNLTMAEAVQNTHRVVGTDLYAALQMATATPSDFLRNPGIGRLAEGAWANFVLLDDNLRVTNVTSV